MVGIVGIVCIVGVVCIVCIAAIVCIVLLLIKVSLLCLLEHELLRYTHTYIRAWWCCHAPSVVEIAKSSRFVSMLTRASALASRFRPHDIIAW